MQDHEGRPRYNSQDHEAHQEVPSTRGNIQPPQTGKRLSRSLGFMAHDVGGWRRSPVLKPKTTKFSNSCGARLRTAQDAPPPPPPPPGALQADWCAQGVWEANRVAFIDNWIVDADTPSRTANLSWEAISKRAANENKRKYALVAEKLRGPTTPLVCSTDSGVHVKYAAFHCRLAAKWDRPYSRVMSWVRMKSQFAIIHAVDLRL